MTKINSFFNEYAEKARHIFGWFIFAFYQRIMSKIFININKFEDYYDVNFDRSTTQYDFYLTHLKRFLGLNILRSRYSSESFPLISDNQVQTSIRISEYLSKVISERRKDYTTVVSDFFSGSFSFFGHFYIFVRDNVFEFMAH